MGYGVDVSVVKTPTFFEVGVVYPTVMQIHLYVTTD